MPKPFEFFFDYVSPTAYLAFHEARRMAEHTGAEIIWRPMFLGGVMNDTGNRPPGMVPAKAAYLGVDIPRCARHIGIPYTMNPHFPFNTRPALRATLGLLHGEDPGEAVAFMQQCFHHAWGIEAPLDLGDVNAMATVCHAAGLDPSRIGAMAEDPANKAQLKENTDEAVRRGVFGAPTFFVGDEIFFGHDRLDYVARAVMN